MSSTALVASAIIAIPLAFAFLYVGMRIHRRGRIEKQPAHLWFAAFWVGIGTYALAEALWSLAYAAGRSPLPFALFVLHVKIVASVVGFGGLVSYLLAIHATDARLRGVVVGAYGVILAITETFYSWRGPIGQEAHTWGVGLVYARNAVEPWWTILLLVLFLPPFLASVSYARLLRHTRDPVIRYRIAMTSASLFLFFVPLFAGWRAGDWPWWGAAEKALAGGMAAGIFLALWPPAAIRARIGKGRDGHPRKDDSALRQRANELI